VTDAGSDPVETYRKAALRLRLLLLGDGVDTVGLLRGETQRGQATAELRRMRTALDAVLESRESQARAISSGAVGLEEELQSIASSRSHAHMQAAAPGLMTPAEAADALTMSVSSIYRAVRKGEIRAVTLTQKRGGLRIPTSELHRLSERIPAS